MTSPPRQCDEITPLWDARTDPPSGHLRSLLRSTLQTALEHGESNTADRQFMSGSAQLAVLVAIGFAGVLVLLNRDLRPHVFTALYLISNVADIGFVVSGRAVPGVPIVLSDILLAAALGAVLLQSGREPLRWPPGVSLLILLFAIGFTQIARGSSHGLDSAFAEGRFVLFPLAWFCGYAVTRRLPRGDQLFQIFAATAVAIAAVGIAVYMSTSALNLEFVHIPGRLAMYAVFATAILLSGVSPSLRRFRPLALAVLAVFLIVSGSRQAFVMVPFLYLVVRRHIVDPRSKFLAILLLVASVSAAALSIAADSENRVAATISDYGDVITDPISDRGTAWRFDYWRALLDDTSGEKWVTGVGIHPYFSELELESFEGDVSDTPHNSFLVITLLAGLPFTLTYLAIMWKTGRRYAAALDDRIGDLGLFLLLMSNLLLAFNAEHRLAGLWPMMWLLLGVCDAQLMPPTVRVERSREAGHVRTKGDVDAVA